MTSRGHLGAAQAMAAASAPRKWEAAGHEHLKASLWALARDASRPQTGREDTR